MPGPPRPKQTLAEHMAATRSERVVQTRGETVAEEDVRLVGVISRDNAEIIED